MSGSDVLTGGRREGGEDQRDEAGRHEIGSMMLIDRATLHDTKR